jgi:hypothetical protein
VPAGGKVTYIEQTARALQQLALVIGRGQSTLETSVTYIEQTARALQQLALVIGREKSTLAISVN